MESSIDGRPVFLAFFAFSRLCHETLTSDFMRSVLKFGTETGEILVSDPLLLFDVGVVDDEEDISPVTLTSRSRLSSSCDELGRKNIHRSQQMSSNSLLCGNVKRTFLFLM